MKTKTVSVIDTVVQRLREQAERFNSSLESAPVAVLWTDERREWESVLPNLKAAMPELFSLGPLSLVQRTGPGVGLRMVADREAGHLQPSTTTMSFQTRKPDSKGTSLLCTDRGHFYFALTPACWVLGTDAGVQSQHAAAPMRAIPDT